MPKESFLDFIDEISIVGTQNGQQRSRGESKKLITEAYNSCGKDTETISFDAWKLIACEWPGFVQGLIDHDLFFFNQKLGLELFFQTRNV